MSFHDELFYELEIEGSAAAPLQTPAQKIAPPPKDEIRERFHAMRKIAWDYRSPYVRPSNFYDETVRRDNARIFYKQARFMRDFEDSFERQVPFSSYYPYYQQMTNEQLRSYFSWRTNVRKGRVAAASLSCAFVYIYELLHNIGVERPQEGLDKLLDFREAFRLHDSSIEKYMDRWVKDYKIYYNLPLDAQCQMESFDLQCAVLKYDIRKSAFYTEETAQLLTDCFAFVTVRLRQAFSDAGLSFDEIVCQPTKRMSRWQPFRDALFYPWMKQPDRCVVLSENEIYNCRDNQWTFSTLLSLESGRQLLGYALKRMEAVLRQAMGCKHKLTAKTDALSTGLLRKIPLDEIITSAALEFYREATKIVVTVDEGALRKIRLEARETQEKLVVPEEESVKEIKEEEKAKEIKIKKEEREKDIKEEIKIKEKFKEDKKEKYYEIREEKTDHWSALKNALSVMEVHALAVVLREANLKEFADGKGVMLEVLADGINEKAADILGDSLLDDELRIYDDYIENIKEMLE
ncbi:MAG: TerB N-terminal domain-containing protein [Oscillospiraceae bacterium]|nr:TerB N-terminal domain-containing protein [Oscillospiraceae bacterium]